MKNITMIFFLLFLIILTSCSNDSKVTEKEAEQIVLDQHSREAGNVEIKSIFSKSDKYIIEWEVEPIETGVDSVHMKTGELKTIESSHGTCKWL